MLDIRVVHHENILYTNNIYDSDGHNKDDDDYAFKKKTKDLPL